MKRYYSDPKLSLHGVTEVIVQRRECEGARWIEISFFRDDPEWPAFQVDAFTDSAGTPVRIEDQNDARKADDDATA